MQQTPVAGTAHGAISTFRAASIGAIPALFSLSDAMGR